MEWFIYVSSFSVTKTATFGVRESTTLNRCNSWFFSNSSATLYVINSEIRFCTQEYAFFEAKRRDKLRWDLLAQQGWGAAAINHCPNFHVGINPSRIAGLISNLTEWYKFRPNFLFRENIQDDNIGIDVTGFSSIFLIALKFHQNYEFSSNIALFHIDVSCV